MTERIIRADGWSISSKLLRVGSPIQEYTPPTIDKISFTVNGKAYLPRVNGLLNLYSDHMDLYFFQYGETIPFMGKAIEFIDNSMEGIENMLDLCLELVVGEPTKFSEIELTGQDRQFKGSDLLQILLESMETEIIDPEPEVTNEDSLYKRLNDKYYMKRFIDERLELDPSSYVGATELYDEYVKFHKENNFPEPCISKLLMGRVLSSFKIAYKQRAHEGMRYYGIRLKTPDET